MQDGYAKFENITGIFLSVSTSLFQNQNMYWTSPLLKSLDLSLLGAKSSIFFRAIILGSNILLETIICKILHKIYYGNDQILCVKYCTKSLPFYHMILCVKYHTKSSTIYPIILCVNVLIVIDKLHQVLSIEICCMFFSDI